MVFSLGSISDYCYAVIEGIPTSISGARMNDIAYGQQKMVENITGQTIGSVDIDEKWWSVLSKFTTAEIIPYMELIGADVSAIKLGDLSVNKGSSSNLASVKETLRASAIQELNRGKLIGIDVYKAFG